ncbi:hypothetical protein [Albibacillus kandeliae]|uniref:hypothetical protein n=1 Tax=Albibacillus kandeliae TaxID=2174228 RepID=UPI001E381787|nr:hypothetical protein [Albibacillus kandeliae]
MRNKLNMFIVPLAVLCIAGAVLVAALVAGFYSWMAFAVSAAAGLLIGVPAGVLITRRIRRDDPNWPDKRPA